MNISGHISLSGSGLFTLGQFPGAESLNPGMWRCFGLPRQLPPPRAAGRAGGDPALGGSEGLFSPGRGALSRPPLAADSDLGPHGCRRSPRSRAAARRARPAPPRSAGRFQLRSPPPRPAAPLAAGFSLGEGSSPAGFLV